MKPFERSYQVDKSFTLKFFQDPEDPDMLIVADVEDFEIGIMYLSDELGIVFEADSGLCVTTKTLSAICDVGEEFFKPRTLQ